MFIENLLLGLNDEEEVYDDAELEQMELLEMDREFRQMEWMQDKSREIWRWDGRQVVEKFEATETVEDPVVARLLTWTILATVALLATFRRFEISRNTQQVLH